MFDSGAGVTVIDSQTGHSLNLDFSGTSTIGTSGKAIETKESKANSLKLGEKFTLENLSFYVMDLSHLSNLLDFKVDGIIGLDLLNQAIVETNISEKELRVYHPSNFVYQGKSAPITLIELESGHFGIPVEIKPKGSNELIKMILKVDTGAANHLTFHQPVIEKYNLINPQKKYKTREGFGADSTMTYNLKSKVSFARLQSTEWKNVPVIFEVDPLNQNSNRKADGLIGQELLLDFNITYDLSEHLIYLESKN